MPTEMTEHRSESSSIDAPATAKRALRLIVTANYGRQILFRRPPHQRSNGSHGRESC